MRAPAATMHVVASSTQDFPRDRTLAVTRTPTPTELKATLVVRLSIVEGSATADNRLSPTIETPAYVTNYTRHR